MKRLAVFVAALMLFTGVSPALATFRGRNGRVAFRRYLNKSQTRGALFTIRRDGTGLRQITNPKRGIVTDEPDWSPNGRWILFQREKGDFTRLFKIRANGSDRTYLSSGCGRICGDGYASWLPGGKRLALQRGLCGTGSASFFAIYVMRADGTHRRRITQQDATCETSHRYLDEAPTVAPKGKRLAFERLDQKRGKHAIFTVHLDGTKLKRVTPWRVDASQPDWSPNGRWIVFRTQKQSDTKGNIALVHPDGTGLHLITHGHGEHKWLSSSFSPNGKRITAGRVPGSGKAANADLYVMNVKGTRRRNLTKSGAWESAPDWGPR